MPKTVRVPDNTAAEEESARKAPSTSIHHRTQQLNISQISLGRILHKDLGMKPYKVQSVQELKPINHPMRFRFAKWACDRLTKDTNFGKKKKGIVFSDEDLCRYVNKRICCFPGTENPHAYIEKPTHPKRGTVWSRFQSRGIIRANFFRKCGRSSRCS